VKPKADALEAFECSGDLGAARAEVALEQLVEFDEL
jgi:hypothetical protein